MPSSSLTFRRLLSPLHKRRAESTPTALEPAFCEACQVLLQGKSPAYRAHDPHDPFTLFWHHKDAESFRLACNRACPICIRIRTGFVREQNHRTKWNDVGQPPPWGPTQYTAQWSYGHQPYYLLDFQSNDLGTNILLKPWDDAMDSSIKSSCDNTGDDQAVAFLEYQYDSCLKNHSRCGLPSETPVFMPTRVLDVGTTESSPVRLRESTELLEQGHYVALSHCWGKVQPLKLVKSNAEELRNGVVQQALPLTFRHAIQVTRKFGVRYLWIDSLCIFQDDLDDWDKQASLMRDVYRHAVVCIAATAAKDGTKGLFRPRDYQSFSPVKVEVQALRQSNLADRVPPPAPGSYCCILHPMVPYSEIDCATLNQRAWVAQERYLSRRILHFTHEILFWECQESFASETHPDQHFSCGCANLQPTPRVIKQVINDSKLGYSNQSEEPQDPRNVETQYLHETSQVYESWCSFREFYTRCQLTKESDILVALRGIALDVGEALNDELVFGHWKRRLLEDLTWRCRLLDDGQTPVEYGRDPRASSWRAPSWSWASSTFPIERGHLGHDQAAIQLAKIMNLPTETKSSGDWQLYSILIRCRLLPASFEYDGTSAFGPRMTSFTFGTVITPAQLGVSVYLDDTNQAGGREKRTVPCHLVTLRKSEAYGKRRLEGLLVVSDDAHPAAYMRIGYCSLDDAAASKVASEVLAVNDNLEEQDLRLL